MFFLPIVHAFSDLFPAAFEESESDSGGSDDTEGEDWDALERKAERDDRKFKEANGDDSGEDERKGRKKNGKR